MLKRIAVILSAIAVVFALAACSANSGMMAVESGLDGVHAVATGTADGTGDGTLTIENGYGICVNHVVDKGVFHVKIKSKTGEVVFDNDVKNNIADILDVDAGEYSIEITAKNAAGTVDVIAADMEAQKMADATMPSDVKNELEKQRNV